MESELREHHRIHLPDRPFLCNVCGMTFKQKKRLRVHHRAVHLRDKRFVCNVCGSSHINNWNLQTHMKTHTQMDTMCHNMCDQCGSMFRGRAGLAAHIRLRHSDTRPQQQQQQHQDQHTTTTSYQVIDASPEHKQQQQQQQHTTTTTTSHQINEGIPEHQEQEHEEQFTHVQIKEENIEHVLVPQQDSDLKMIEVYSCNSCYHLCDSWEHLASHMQRNHHLLLYPELVP
ncbi:hypothetical protein Pcinc_011943 [Petrolisthes cinctipes]|uniref:C2H2-type domain-containing protein n=1 Tax=Petrolisthes cinctipes TaxID=88211 RepID=A0AAE1G038_PETCI|nr:hypothetical protein Pcinc_011943 [Petrolisthes cinctipes]